MQNEKFIFSRSVRHEVLQKYEKEIIAALRRGKHLYKIRNATKAKPARFKINQVLKQTRHRRKQQSSF